MKEFDVETVDVEDVRNDAPQNISELLTAGAAVQQIRTNTQMQISVQRPRNLKLVESNVLQEAALAGEKFFYQWSVTNKGRKAAVDGTSIEGAMILARIWGNCCAEIERVDDMIHSFNFFSTFTDFETNFSVTRSYKIRKDSIVHGKMDDARKEDIRFQVAQSKSLRNAILAGIPTWLKEKAFQRAKAGVREKLESYIKKHSLAKAQAYAVTELSKFGITPERICTKFEIADTKGLDIDKLVIIRGDFNAIQEGAENADMLYPPIENNGGNANELAERLKQKVKASKKPATQHEPAPAKSTDENPPDNTGKPEKVSENANTGVAPNAETEFVNNWRNQSLDELSKKYMELRESTGLSMQKAFSQLQKNSSDDDPVKKMKNTPPSFKNLYEFRAEAAVRLLYWMQQ